MSDSNYINDAKEIYEGSKINLDSKGVLELYKIALSLAKKKYSVALVVDAVETVINKKDELIYQMLKILDATNEETVKKHGIKTIQEQITKIHNSFRTITIKPNDRLKVMRYLPELVKELVALIDSKYPRAITAGRRDFCKRVVRNITHIKTGETEKKAMTEASLSKILNLQVLPNESTLVAIFEALGIESVRIKEKTFS